MLEPQPFLVLQQFPQPGAVGCIGRTELWVTMVASFIPGAVATVDELSTEARKTAPGK